MQNFKFFHKTYRFFRVGMNLVWKKVNVNKIALLRKSCFFPLHIIEYNFIEFSKNKLALLQNIIAN